MLVHAEHFDLGYGRRVRVTSSVIHPGGATRSRPCRRVEQCRSTLRLRHEMTVQRGRNFDARRSVCERCSDQHRASVNAVRHDRLAAIDNDFQMFYPTACLSIIPPILVRHIYRSQNLAIQSSRFKTITFIYDEYGLIGSSSVAELGHIAVNLICRARIAGYRHVRHI